MTRSKEGALELVTKARACIEGVRPFRSPDAMRMLQAMLDTAEQNIRDEHYLEARGSLTALMNSIIAVTRPQQ